AQARRIALGAQGFADKRPAGAVDVRHFRRALDRMTILQLDAVNVLARSHFLPMFSRLGPYDRDRLDRWIWRSGENHEYVAHEASITSMDLHPLLRWKMGRGRWNAGRELEEGQPEYLDAILDEIERHGPRSIKTLDDPGTRTGPWWGMPRGKVALEWLYYTGRLSIHHRDHQFTTHYDLPHRIVPAHVSGQPTPTTEEAQAEMLMLGARSHGIGTAADLADYFRIKMPEARPLLAQLVAEGRLEPVTVEGWSAPAYLHPEAKRPRAIDVATVLSPFDPVVWFRDRAERLWDFHYRIEIYVPEPKRQYGYYVLPFLLGDDLVARVDLKADRAAGVLRVKGAFAEADAELDEVATPLATNLVELAGWLGLAEVEVGNGDLAPALRSAVRSVAA
ncbi:MAG: crosslink repair DNA glycosylase YcaQ family protein, partial [Acidimicrobiales bacterium]